MSLKLDWTGDQAFNQIAENARAALTEIDQRIEAAAKAELYPGHGKMTGTLQRGVVGDAAKIEGSRIRGKIGTKGIPYALRLHRRYRYIKIGLDTVRPQVGAVLRRHMRGRG